MAWEVNLFFKSRTAGHLQAGTRTNLQHQLQDSSEIVRQPEFPGKIMSSCKELTIGKTQLPAEVTLHISEEKKLQAIVSEL